MQLPKELTTVTPLSKNIALIMFTLLPIIAFILGMNYQANLADYKSIAPPEKKACTLEAKICPDGSFVGRTGPNCEFAPCSDNQNTDEEKLSGLISDLKYDCNSDGICSVPIGE